MIKDRLFSDIKMTRLLVPYDKGSAVSALMKTAKPVKTEYREDGTYLEAELSSADRGRYAQFIIEGDS